MPTDLHREFVRKLGRLAGETDADVDTKLFAFYARRCASLLPQQPIVENDFRFWRRSYAEAFSPATAARAAPLRMVAPPAADIWARVLERLEPKVSRHTFYTWFRDTRLVDDRGDVIEVTRPGSHSELVAGWIPKHYSEVVHQAMEEIRPGTRVTFVVDSGARQRKSG